MSKCVINWNDESVRDCFHESAECYGAGLHCVYFWEDESGEVFYVGSGKGYRFNDIKSRSAEFVERYNQSINPRPRIVAYGMEKEESLLFETRLIKAFKKRGFPLVNKDGVTRHFLQTVTYNGRTRTYGSWGKEIGVSGGTIKARIEKLGWPIEKALFAPSAQDVAHQQMKDRRMAKQNGK